MADFNYEDCVSNAAELVEELREAASEDDSITFNYEYIEEIADAIEQLIAENAKLKAERDAAVADLERTGSCLSCVHCNQNDLTCDCLDECALGTESKWEWRGVKEKEDD